MKANARKGATARTKAAAKGGQGRTKSGPTPRQEPETKQPAAPKAAADSSAEQRQAIRKAAVHLSSSVPASQFFALVSRYCSPANTVQMPSSSGGSPLDCVIESILAGRPKLFLMHSQLDTAAAGSGRRKEEERGGDSEEEEDGSDEDAGGSGAGRSLKAPEAPGKLGVLAHAAIPPPEFGAEGLGDPALDAEAWRCIRCAALNFPTQTEVAVRMCIQAGVDPSALGPVRATIDAAAGCSDARWEELADLFDATGLGLWPHVKKRLDAETALRAKSAEEGRDFDP